MTLFDRLKDEMSSVPSGMQYIRNIHLYNGYKEHFGKPVTLMRAYAVESLFNGHEKIVYENDIILGSLRGNYAENTDAGLLQRADTIVSSFGENRFWTNSDHFAPDYASLMQTGTGGIIENINACMKKYENDGKKTAFLTAAGISMRAFSDMIRGYADAAQKKADSATHAEVKDRLTEAARICRNVVLSPPAAFREALQLMWLTHLAFLYEGRYAMALGRIDQFLYPFYIKDVESGALTYSQAVEMLACTLYKIGELQRLRGGDDVVNIAIGGVTRDGSDAINELSYAVLEAVGLCNIPGPNLSARLHKNAPVKFLDECLKVIGTGLGYPALMNDEINIPALSRHGYTIEDSRDYSMVGCIENFITGKQPPWSDGRFNTPKFLELAMNDGRCMQTGVQTGPNTGNFSDFADMDAFMTAFKTQIEYGASEYVTLFNNENDRYNKNNYTQPFLSCFCQNCIDRGLDINDGGALYPSVHGAACLGIATVSDSLAAIELNVFDKKTVGAKRLVDALLNDYKNDEQLRQTMMSAPKYGNDDNYADKYAVWFVEYLDGVFSKYRTRDGGAYYTAIAANTNNIGAGKLTAATPDGRKNGMPLSDAASPTYGLDKNGPTAVVNSTTKPDYTFVSCGTVLNQKYSPEMFSDPEKRARLLAMIKTYFDKGGQEMQINSVSRKTLIDAMDNPDKYSGLVVRVSGFSAYYTTLGRDIQEDILNRTEHE